MMTACLLTLALLAQDKQESPKVEAVFVLDTTGSMGGLIDGAKKKIWSIVNEIASGKPTPVVKVGFVIYRDKGDQYVTKTYDLTEDLDKAFADLKTFAAGGGGDGPEHVTKGLSEAVDSIHWSNDKVTYKVIFLVARSIVDVLEGYGNDTQCLFGIGRDDSLAQRLLFHLRQGNHRAIKVFPSSAVAENDFSSTLDKHAVAAVGEGKHGGHALLGRVKREGLAGARGGVGADVAVLARANAVGEVEDGTLGLVAVLNGQAGLGGNGVVGLGRAVQGNVLRDAVAQIL